MRVRVCVFVCVDTRRVRVPLLSAVTLRFPPLLFLPNMSSCALLSCRPFWLSPRQVRVVPVIPKFDEYAKEVAKVLLEAGFESEVDTNPGDTMNKKIRNAQLEQWNYIMGESRLDTVIC